MPALRPCLSKQERTPGPPGQLGPRRRGCGDAAATWRQQARRGRDCVGTSRVSLLLARASLSPAPAPRPPGSASASPSGRAAASREARDQGAGPGGPRARKPDCGPAPPPSLAPRACPGRRRGPARGARVGHGTRRAAQAPYATAAPAASRAAAEQSGAAASTRYLRALVVLAAAAAGPRQVDVAARCGFAARLCSGGRRRRRRAVPAGHPVLRARRGVPRKRAVPDPAGHGAVLPALRRRAAQLPRAHLERTERPRIGAKRFTNHSLIKRASRRRRALAPALPRAGSASAAPLSRAQRQAA
jgi:hypothetical protein